MNEEEVNIQEEGMETKQKDAIEGEEKNEIGVEEVSEIGFKEKSEIENNEIMKKMNENESGEEEEGIKKMIIEDNSKGKIDLVIQTRKAKRLAEGETEIATKEIAEIKNKKPTGKKTSEKSKENACEICKKKWEAVKDKENERWIECEGCKYWICQKCSNLKLSEWKQVIDYTEAMECILYHCPKCMEEKDEKKKKIRDGRKAAAEKEKEKIKLNETINDLENEIFEMKKNFEEEKKAAATEMEKKLEKIKKKHEEEKEKERKEYNEKINKIEKQVKPISSKIDKLSLKNIDPQYEKKDK